MTNAHPLLLVAHPDNPPLPVERVVAAVCPLAEGGVRLRYRLACPADALRSVTPAPPGLSTFERFMGGGQDERAGALMEQFREMEARMRALEAMIQEYAARGEDSDG